jgi:tetratricopeptide (TPR) repeat protein
MTFKRKITRKQFLNQPDQFISTSQHIVEFIQQNTRLITSILIGVFCLLVFGGLGYLYLNRVKRGAQKLEVDALDIYHQPLLTTKDIEIGRRGFKNEAERYQASLPRFQQIKDEYGWTQNGQRAMLYIADCYYGLGEFKKASEVYNQYLAEYPEDKLMGFIVRQNLGYVSEAQNQLDEAINHYQQALEETTSQAGFQLYLNIARCYELKQDWQQALNTYNDGLAAFPESRSIPEIAQHIKELEVMVSSTNPPQPSSL